MRLRTRTCPLVRHAHGQLRRLVEEEGCFPVIIGKHGHVEVLGLAGDFPEAVVLETEADLGRIPERPLYGVISQTTQPIQRVLRLVVALRACRPNSRVRFRDTVCRPTKERQEALRKLIGEVEVVIVVGGRNSNNTRELVETVRAAGLPAHHIERADELRRGVVRGDRTRGDHRRDLDAAGDGGRGAAALDGNDRQMRGGSLMDAAEINSSRSVEPGKGSRIAIPAPRAGGHDRAGGLLLVESDIRASPSGLFAIGAAGIILMNRPGMRWTWQRGLHRGAHLRRGGGIGHRPLLFQCAWCCSS